jgi:hypothetical protein
VQKRVATVCDVKGRPQDGLAPTVMRTAPWVKGRDTAHRFSWTAIITRI